MDGRNLEVAGSRIGFKEIASRSPEQVLDRIGRATPPEIFLTCFGKLGPSAYNVAAIDQTGEIVAGHICSHPGYFLGDMGALSDLNPKHHHYRKRHSKRYDLVWIAHPQFYDRALLAAAFSAVKQFGLSFDEWGKWLDEAQASKLEPWMMPPDPTKYAATVNPSVLRFPFDWRSEDDESNP